MVQRKEILLLFFVEYSDVSYLYNNQETLTIGSLVEKELINYSGFKKTHYCYYLTQM